MRAAARHAPHNDAAEETAVPDSDPPQSALHPGLRGKVVVLHRCGPGPGAAPCSMPSRGNGCRPALLDMNADGTGRRRPQLRDRHPGVETLCLQASVRDDAAVEQAYAARARISAAWTSR